jgi:hypothetical protein
MFVTLLSLFYVSKHHHSKNLMFIFKGTEIFIIVVAFINLLKFVYVSFQDILMTKRVPFQDEWEELGIYICMHVYNYVFYTYIYV